MDLTILFNILASIGGASGIINLFKWIKNKNANIKILFSIGDFHFDQDDLIVHTKLQLTNERDEATYVTDIIGLIKEDPSKRKNPNVFTMRPTNPIFSPTKLEAKGTIELDFEINFSNIEIDKIKRRVLAKFIGFMDGVPIYQAKESDFDEKWDELPLEMELFIHINGKELLNTNVVVFSAETTNGSFGSIDSVQIAQLQHNYLFGKKKT